MIRQTWQLVFRARARQVAQSCSRHAPEVALAAASVAGASLVLFMLSFSGDALRALRYPVDEYIGEDENALIRVPLGEATTAPDIAPFYLQKFEVTNQSYARFIAASRYVGPPGRSSYLTNDDLQPWKDVDSDWRRLLGDIADKDRPNHPVVGVAYADAAAYCAFYKMRLPRREEWAHAARGGTKTAYWWGKAIPRFRRVGNFADRTLIREYPKFLKFGVALSGYDDGYAKTSPVGAFEPNPYGLHDMLGGLWEWVAGDCNDPSQRLREGGSWSANEHYLSVDLKNCKRKDLKSDDTGFRCAMDMHIVR
jgi:formylglycine-generating enzyme required for sulfatase activity